MKHVERRSQQPTAPRAGRWLFAVAVSGSALAVGTVHTITLCVITAVLGVSAALVWWSADPIRVRRAATLLLLAGLALVGYTALQCVPMPIRWLAVIAPHNADVWSRALVPLHEAGPSWAPLTLDPPGTRIELLKGVAYLLAFVIAVRIAHRREGVSFVSATIVVTGVVVALAALLHPAFRMHKLFGIYEPGPEIALSYIAPFMNPNNLAGYINIAFCLSLAAALSREPRVPRTITIVLAILLGATQVWIASRGGVIAMLLGAIAMAALILGERVKRRDPQVWVTVGCAAAFLVGGILIVVGSSDRVHDDLFDANVSKFAVLRGVGQMLRAYGIFGVGRGSFESVYPQFRDWPGHFTQTQPENVIAQWTAEWGLPVGLAGLATIVIALRPTAALARSRTAAGAWAALVAILAQNMADFSTEIPGVMLAVVVCAAIVVAGSAGRAPTWTFERWSQSRSLLGSVSPAICLLGLVGGGTALDHHVGEDRRRLHDRVILGGTTVDQAHDLARGAILRHPAEPYLPFAVALRATHARDENPLPWLAATLERASIYGVAHLLLARVVAPRSPSQARLEYRLAVEQTPELEQTVVNEAPRLVGSYDDALELVPAGREGVSMIRALGASLQGRLPATCARLDEELNRRAPSAREPFIHAVTAAVKDLESGEGAPWCGGDMRKGCLESALASAHTLVALDPAKYDGYGLEARALTASGQAVQAMDRLGRACDTVGERVPCLQLLAGLASEAHDEPRLDTALKEISKAGCVDKEQCISNLVWVASTEEHGGNPRRALATYKRAFERAPDDDSLLENIARLAKATGLNAEALRDYQELARRHPDDVRWKQATEEQHGEMLRNAVKL